jgi:hypothetical protein
MLFPMNEKLDRDHPLVIEAARDCHEMNRIYCVALGDRSQVPWDQAPAWQRESAISGVLHAMNPEVGPGDSHRSWLAEKENQGWKFGPVKDVEKKEHPCCVPFEQLPFDQIVKDYLFLAVARATLCPTDP